MIRLLLLILVLMSCSEVSRLGLQEHEFGKDPDKIIWLQVAGLHEEQLAILKFGLPVGRQTIELEKFPCAGKLWNYNLYEIRHPSHTGFMTQLTGKSNIKNTCADFDHNTVWSFLQNDGFDVGIFENRPRKNQSLLKSRSCKKSKYLEDVVYWKSASFKIKGEQEFHSTMKKEFQENVIYSDSSCRKSKCFSSLSENLISTIESFSKNRDDYIYIFRDFSLERAILNKNVKKIKEILFQLNSAISYLTANIKDSLIIVSSSGSLGIEFPKAGKDYIALERKNSFNGYKKRTLLSPIWATGYRAENFCGYYQENDILTRIFSKGKNKSVIDILNYE